MQFGGKSGKHAGIPNLVKLAISKSSRRLALVSCFGGAKINNICQIWHLGSFLKVFLTS